MKEARRSLKRFVADNYGGVVQRFADAHGFSRPLVSMWLSGRRTPGIKNALRLQAATGISWTRWNAAADVRRRLTASERRALASPP
jgi:transcriptional regulator with XRE-family HTH domain